MDRHDLIPNHGLVATVGENASRVGGEAFEEAFQYGGCSVRCQGWDVGVVVVVVCGHRRAGELEMGALGAELFSYVLLLGVSVWC